MKRIVIGGGMSGLVAAISGARRGIETTVIERNNRLGKKISMTGNGKCNILNVNAVRAHYNTSSIVDMVTSAVSVSNCRDFLKSIGIYTFTDQSGRVYPLTENANSVVDCLRFACEKYGVNVILNTTVQSVTNSSGVFTVKTTNGDYSAHQVVLSVGSGSQAQPVDLGGIVPQQYFTPTAPGLVSVKVKNMDKTLAGLRVKTIVSLLDGNTQLAISCGEVQFRDFGLSGICIMDLSSYIAREMVQGISRKYVFSIDLLPYLTADELYEELSRRKTDGATSDKLFWGLLHNKIAEAVLNRANSNDLHAIVNTIKHFTYTFDKLLDFSASQVTVGGIDERHVSDTLQLPNGIYAIGEVLNVDGLCGGYNLYFAIASALYLDAHS
jgi:predicted Rossmann fold flavoprotein